MLPVLSRAERKHIEKIIHKIHDKEHARRLTAICLFAFKIDPREQSGWKVLDNVYQINGCKCPATIFYNMHGAYRCMVGSKPAKPKKQEPQLRIPASHE